MTTLKALLRRSVLSAAGFIDGSNASAKPSVAADSDVATQYEQLGYVIFRGVLPQQSVQAVCAAVAEDVVTSDRPFVRHHGGHLEPNRLIRAGLPENALLDAHLHGEPPRLAAALKALLCTDAMADLLHSLDGAASYDLHQTILFFVPPGTAIHVDGWGMDTLPQGFAHTLWIPLEAVTLRNGPVAIVPWQRGHYASPEALGLNDFDSWNISEQSYETYHDALVARIRADHPDCVVPLLEPGDLVVFSSTTPHGTLPPVDREQSRLAIQVRVRPSHLRWGSWPKFFRGGFNHPDHGLRETCNDRWRLTS